MGRGQGVCGVHQGEGCDRQFRVVSSIAWEQHAAGPSPLESTTPGQLTPRHNAHNRRRYADTHEATFTCRQGALLPVYADTTAVAAAAPALIQLAAAVVACSQAGDYNVPNHVHVAKQGITAKKPRVHDSKQGITGMQHGMRSGRAAAAEGQGMVD